MASTLVIPPAAPPVTLAEAKAHLRVTHDDEDSLIEDLIGAATRFLADNDGICLLRQTWRYFIDDIASTRCIYRFPAIGINQATAFDGDGNASIIDPTHIELETRKRPAELKFDDVSVHAISANGAEVDIDFGFGETPLDVPDTLKRALLVLIAHWYEFRAEVAPKDQPVSIPDQYNRLVASFRLIGLGA
ncbi:MAG: head-tail connector protein [Pseudomonadota bacterium]